MRTMLVAGLLAGIAGLSQAEDKKADVVGTWKLEYAIGDMKRTSELTVKKDGDKLAGTMSWPDQKEAKLTDLKLAGNELTFAAERGVMDRKFTVKYTLKVDGDKLKGKGSVDANGETREFDIEGTREKKGDK